MPDNVVDSIIDNLDVNIVNGLVDDIMFDINEATGKSSIISPELLKGCISIKFIELFIKKLDKKKHPAITNLKESITQRML